MFSDKRLTVVGGAVRQRPTQGASSSDKVVTARHNVTSYFPNQMGSTPTSVMGFGSNQYIRTLSGIVPDQQEEALIDYYRDCYYYDNIGGATVDIVSVFPFSGWTLGGVSKETAEVYSEALARLNMRLMMPEISRDHLVDGDFIGTLVYDGNAKTFSDIMVHDRLACTVTPSPLRSVDAAITVHSNVRLQQYMQIGNKFSEHLLRNYPTRMLHAFLNGNVDLDPLTTLHIPRKALQDRGSASYLKRILPYYLLERTMYRGTLIEATKRQRATTHVQVGDDTWEPTSAELLAIRDMFQNTELDPLGAWVITRQGIQIQDVRPGGEFWKWTDIVDQVTPMKLRALGISEAFLSGDACLTGDTLISTNQGLRRLDSIVAPKHQRNRWQDIGITVKSRFTEEALANKWVYNGYKDVFAVVTRSGHKVKATANHQLLTFNGVTNVWKRVDQLSRGDLLCVDTRKLTRKARLNLNLPDFEWQANLTDKLGRSQEGKSFWAPRDVRKPKVMTPELAYSLGFLVAEGSVVKYGALIYNTNKEMLDRSLRGLENAFGVKRRLVYTQKRGSSYSINGVTGTTSKDNYCYSIAGAAVAFYLEQMGVTSNKSLRLKNYLRTGDEGLPSHAKEVPWSILAADESSQWAFLAGFLDGDGSVKSRFTLSSTSNSLLEQLQTLLNALGVYSKRNWNGKEGKFRDSLVVEGGFATILAEGVRPFIVKKLPDCRNYRSFKSWSMPVAEYTEEIRARKVGYSTRFGQGYQTDDGDTIVISKTSFGPKRKNITGRSVLPYDNRDVASGFNQMLKALSPTLAGKFREVFDQKHVFVPVESITYLGKDHVYDLAMEEGTEPAFVANGVVVHNSYATAEAALSVFLENMEAYREFITYKVFDSKLFPLIAVLKGLYKDKSKVRNPDSVRDLIFNANNQKNLEIPTLQWHKSLEAKEQDNQFEVLEKLSEKGYPIPMKMWAAAANIDIGSLLSDLKEDQEIKKSITQITGVNPDQNAQLPGEDEGGFGMEASTRRSPLSQVETRSINDPRQSRRGPPLLSREFDPGIKRMSRSGKVAHAVINERAHIKKGNDLIMKATRALEDPNNREKVRRQIIARLGRLPNLLGVPGK